MDQTRGSGDPEESSAHRARSYDSVELLGVGAVIGDGRYRLTRRLGRGGMAEVFAAEDVRLGRTVAVKLLRSDLAEDPVSKKRFTREAQSVAGLNHHAVVAVYDSGEDRIGGNVVPYIVMELCEGRTIRDLLLESEAPPVDQALVIVSGVLEALAYSHQHGIVHRDIKPANVIITDAGNVKVMDFGIARALHGASNTMTQTGMVMGTPQYLSPEQALGKTVDHRSDLYATGCLLYELLTLRPPFTGETPLSVVYQHVQDNPQVPSQVNGRVPPELDGLVLRSLAKDPDDRFQSAEEMLGVLHYALRMLGERGGWTGNWDTGYVDVQAATTVLPGAAAATTALPHAAAGQTAQMRPPTLLGPGGAEGDGGYHDGGPRGGRGGSNRGRNTVLLVLAALVAITLGVWFAVSAANPKKHEQAPATSVSPSVSSSSSPSTEPSASDSAGDQPTTGDQNSGDEGGSSWNNQPPSNGHHSREPSSPPPTSGNSPSNPPADGGQHNGGTTTGSSNTGTSTGSSAGNSGTTTGSSAGNSGTSTGSSAGNSGASNGSGNAGSTVGSSAGNAGQGTLAGSNG